MGKLPQRQHTHVSSSVSDFDLFCFRGVLALEQFITVSSSPPPPPPLLVEIRGREIIDYCRPGGKGILMHSYYELVKV